MKPLMSDSAVNDALLTLGRASVQIVHDLKNQLNGLKLYATFLRKRLEKSERPADELETIKKLMAGLDRTAADLSMIVEFGQPLDLKRQQNTDLEKLMRDAAASLNDAPPTSGDLRSRIVVDSEPTTLLGEFDSPVLVNALKSISLSAIKLSSSKRSAEPLQIRLKTEANGATANGVIEWKIFELDHDPFKSFVGSNEIRLSLAARAIEAHGGTANYEDGNLRVCLPLTPVNEVKHREQK
jgi:light-regulated signal transduction histidine kinase (bacteriophytochrome)